MAEEFLKRAASVAAVLAAIAMSASPAVAGWGRTPSGLCQFFGHGYGRGYHAPIVYRGAVDHAYYGAPYVVPVASPSWGAAPAPRHVHPMPLDELPATDAAPASVEPPTNSAPAAPTLESVPPAPPMRESVPQATPTIPPSPPLFDGPQSPLNQPLQQLPRSLPGPPLGSPSIAN